MFQSIRHNCISRRVEGDYFFCLRIHPPVLFLKTGNHPIVGSNLDGTEIDTIFRGRLIDARISERNNSDHDKA